MLIITYQAVSRRYPNCIPYGLPICLLLYDKDCIHKVAFNTVKSRWLDAPFCPRIATQLKLPLPAVKSIGSTAMIASALPDSDVLELLLIGTILYLNSRLLLIWSPLSGCFISLMLFGVILAQVGASFGCQVRELLSILRQWGLRIFSNCKRWAYPGLYHLTDTHPILLQRSSRDESVC